MEAKEPGKRAGRLEVTTFGRLDPQQDIGQCSLLLPDSRGEIFMVQEFKKEAKFYY